MKKIGIFYGSTTGSTEAVAKTISKKLQVASADVYDVSKLDKETISKYDILILGSSTWGDGELQDDWYDGSNIMSSMDLSGKTIAFFGCGDSASYSDTFCDAMGILYNDLKRTGCTFCGAFPTEGYTFDGSAAIIDGQFIGLPIDDMNEDNLTEGRIDAWIDILNKECLS